jgi:hypothetical protein
MFFCKKFTSSSEVPIKIIIVLDEFASSIGIVESNDFTSIGKMKKILFELKNDVVKTQNEIFNEDEKNQNFGKFFLKFTNIQKDIDSSWKLLLDAATLLDHTVDHKIWESQKIEDAKMFIQSEYKQLQRSLHQKESECDNFSFFIEFKENELSGEKTGIDLDFREMDSGIFKCLFQQESQKNSLHISSAEVERLFSIATENFKTQNKI